MDKKIKILILVNKLKIGGAEKLAVAQVNLLDKKFFDPYLGVFYLTDKANFVKDLTIPDDHLVNFNFKSFWNFNNWLIFFRFLNQNKFDIVCTHLFEANFLGRFMAIICRIPVIFCFEHSMYFNKHFWQKIIDYILAKFTYKILTDSQAIIDFTTKQEKINPAKFKILFYPVKPPRLNENIKNKLIDEFKIKKSDFVALNVGRFAEVKGQKYIIEAAKKICFLYPEIKFFIAGTGSMHQELLDLVKKYNLTDSVRIINAGAEANLFLNIADIFILSSLREGQPITLLEAMSVGKVVVASNVGGVKEVVKPGYNGFIYEPGDIDQLAKHIINLYKNRQSVKELGKNGMETSKKFMGENYIKEFEQILIDGFNKKTKKFDEIYFKNLERLSLQQRFKDDLDLVYKIMPPLPGQKILDVACGTGRLGLFLLEKNSNLDIIFSDISPCSNKYLSNYQFVNCPAEQMSFSDNYFDKIYCIYAISHFKNQEAAVMELYRITKNGGKILIATPNKIYVIFLIFFAALKIIPEYKFDKTINKLYTINSLKRLFQKQGMQIEEAFYYGDFLPRFPKFNFFRMRLLLIAKK